VQWLLWCCKCQIFVGLGVCPLRAEPLSKAQHLAPDGLPSLTLHRQAAEAG
jgi:hypothetical protein